MKYANMNINIYIYICIDIYIVVLPHRNIIIIIKILFIKHLNLLQGLPQTILI